MSLTQPIVTFSEKGILDWNIYRMKEMSVDSLHPRQTKQQNRT
jgi:hypothetical protein